MRNIVSECVLALFMAASASVPVEWSVDQSRVQPLAIEAYHGETLDLRATFPGVFASASATFLWQTNGMSGSWWQKPASVSGSKVYTSFTPEMDTGSDRIRFFFSVVSGSGASYRASGSITFRPSPGAVPSTNTLPAPGETINFSDVTVLNAPWATVSDVQSAIESATNAIVIPPPQDLSSYATVSDVDEAITVTKQAASNMVIAASNALLAAISSSSQDLSTYATKEYADSAASNAVAGVQIPSLAGYATESYVDNKVESVPSPDLSPYATKQYADSAASNAVAGVQIPSLAGYATESYVDNKVASVQSTDLSPYATKQYADSAASNAVAGVQIPSLAGYATESYVRDAVSGGIVKQTRSTILETIDGLQWQDATGVVWKAEMNYAWVGTNGVVFVYDESGEPNYVSGSSSIYLTRDGWRMKDGTNDVLSDNAPYVGRDTNQLVWNQRPGLTLYGVYNWSQHEYAGYSTNAIKQVAYVGSGGGNVLDTNAVKLIIADNGCVTTNLHGVIPAARLGYGSVVEARKDRDPFHDNGLIFIDGFTNSEVGGFITFDWDNYRPLFSDYDTFHTLAFTSEIPKTSSQIGAYPAANGEELSAKVNSWQTYWDGDDVRVTVTNYYGSAGLPSLYLEQKMPTNETHATPWFKTIWDERTRWNSFLSVYNTLTNSVANDLADRAWGVYDSSSGAYSPDGLLQLSQEQIMIASGMAYQKTVTAGGCSVWVLKSTSPTTISGVTSNGFFRIEDGDGNALFEIVKGDKRVVGATATGVSMSGNTMTITYNSVSDEHPTLEICTNLNTADWKTETETTVATVSWGGSSGAWVATVTPIGSRSSLFAKATFEAGGNTYIKNNVASSLDKVVVGGVEYTVTVETVNGKKLMVLQ